MNRSFRAGAATGRTVTKEADEELALFLEMRKLEKERNNLLLHGAGELDPPLGNVVIRFSFLEEMTSFCSFYPLSAVSCRFLASNTFTLAALFYVSCIVGAKPGTAPIFKIASSAPARKAGIDDFLNSDSEKNDYDWYPRNIFLSVRTFLWLFIVFSVKCFPFANAITINLEVLGSLC